MAMEYPFEPPSVLFQSIGMPVDTRVDSKTLEEFAKVLMTIVGAKGSISMWERGWLAAFLSAYDAPPDLMRKLEDFDYAHTDPDPLLAPLLVGYFGKWVRRCLVQSAIRMSRADTLEEAEFRRILAVAARLGIKEEDLHEIHGLLNIFDSVSATSTQLLSTAQTEDNLRPQTLSEPIDPWDDSVNEPEAVLLSMDQLVFAQAVIYIMGADGEVSDAELGEFIAHMRAWGATEEQIAALREFDYQAISADDIIAGVDKFNWGLSALTAVALRVAGADGFSAEEENALMELYRKTGRSLTIYYATKGLEDVRRMALDRLNAIFAAYI